MLHAAPAGLAALALLLLLVLVRDALWRGPVTVPQATVDWLLDTPVDRGRLLRPRFRLSAALTTVAGAAVGIVPAAALVAAGLGGARQRGRAPADRRGGGVGGPAVRARHRRGRPDRAVPGQAGRWVRAATPAVLAAAALLAGLAAWAALGRPPAVLSAVAVWSGPWGWSAQPVAAAAGHAVSGGAGLGSIGVSTWWPLAAALLAAAALAALAAADRAAAGVSGSVLRARARDHRRHVGGGAEHEHPRGGRGVPGRRRDPAGPSSGSARHGGAGWCCCGATCSRWPGRRPGWPPR